MEKCFVCGKAAFIPFNGKNICFGCFADIIAPNGKKDVVKKLQDKKEEIMKLICDDCGKEIIGDDFKTLNDKNICNDCFNENYLECDICDNYFSKDSDYEYYRGQLYCENCVENNLTTCDDCGAHIHQDDAYYTADDRVICNRCYEENYFTCDTCGGIFYSDDYMNCTDYCCYCPDCYENEVDSHNIHSYDYKPYIVFHSQETETKDRETNLHVGIELEIQGGDRRGFVEDFNNTFSENDFYMKEDGSLDESGVEIVSMPMTYNYLMNTNLWYEIFKMMKQYGMDDTDGCGLHFHLDNNYLNDIPYIATIDYIVNHFSDYFSKIGGRIYDEFSRYCKQVNKNENDWGRRTMYESRYQAVNLTNDNTTELRFCKSTSDFDTFIKRVKMIFAIASFAKTYNINKVQNLSKDDFATIFDKFMNDNFKNQED